MVCATSKASDHPAHTHSLIRTFTSRLNKLLTEHHLEFLSYKGGCTGSSESIHVKCHIVRNHISRLISGSCGTRSPTMRYNGTFPLLCHSLNKHAWLSTGDRSGDFLPISRGQISAPFPIKNSHLFSQYHV